MLVRTGYLLILLAFVAPIARTQEATKTCTDGQTIKIASQWDQLGLTMAPSDLAAQPLRYAISSPKSVQAAWIEVWDQPTRLSRTSVAVVHDGEASCANCLDAERTPRELYISIFDSDEPLICIDYCGKRTRTSGAYVSEVRAGKQPEEDYDETEEPAYLIEYPSLTGNPIRVLAGSGSINVVLQGEDLIASSRVYVVAGEEASPKESSRTYLYSRTLDLRHVEVTLPSDMVEKPGMLTLYVKDAWNGPEPEGSRLGQKIIVASQDSPVISSIKPDRVICRGSSESDVSVLLEGSGFTDHSQVEFGDDTYIHPSTKFVSPTELQVNFPEFDLRNGERYCRAGPLNLTVMNGPLEISAYREIRVLPSAKFRREPLSATILALTPYPVPMMNFKSSKFLTLEIAGDNFRANDFVAARNEDSHYERVKTQYISPHHLRAWIPRELWREHRLSFRFIVQTSAGLCTAEAFADSLE